MVAMDIRTADTLRELNNRFYQQQYASFAQTRQAPWPGWKKCLEFLPSQQSLSVFDLACGNLRFKAFLTSALPDTTFTFYAIDSCDELAPPDPSVNYQHLDILDALNQELNLNNQLTAPPCDLSVAFGFLHHVPLPEHRAQTLAALIDQAKPGGFVIVSLWQFMSDPARREKTLLTHERALQELGLPALHEGDYILGWKDIPGAYRYCHSFSDAEVDQLASSVASRATLAARFKTDGRTGNLNTYLIFKADWQA